MKSRFILITAILASTAAFGVANNAVASPPDAQSTASAQLGDHPAVVVARTQAKRGVDANTFIVAHPARLQLLAASPSAKSEQQAAKVDAPISVAAGR